MNRKYSQQSSTEGDYVGLQIPTAVIIKDLTPCATIEVK
jgi:hypothetical protein